LIGYVPDTLYMYKYSKLNFHILFIHIAPLFKQGYNSK
jgi:hypothetical protein